MITSMYPNTMDLISRLDDLACLAKSLLDASVWRPWQPPRSFKTSDGYGFMSDVGGRFRVTWRDCMMVATQGDIDKVTLRINSDRYYDLVFNVRGGLVTVWRRVDFDDETTGYIPVASGTEEFAEVVNALPRVTLR